MSFFYPEIPQKEKVVSHHPWEKYIKDAYTSTYKYGHNSAKNPVYPPKKIKVPSINCVKFTIIGNRVTKEFIYSINLVKGLHKYRSKYFDAPVIRGLTSVEWPKVWNDLKIQYGGLAYCLQSQVAVLINEQFLGGDKELKDLIESKYVYDLHPNYYGEAVQLFSSYVKSSGRPCAYLQISVDDADIGTMIFMLYADIVPRTCENFLRLCKTNKGGYAGTPVHRIVQDCWIQCGGFGIQSSELDCENFIVPHDRRGVLGMANDGRHIDCSTQFFVLLQPATWMAHKYVAFGQLIDGEQTLQKIEQIPTFYESPTKRIIIFKAGILNMECKDIMINRGTNHYIAGHIENLLTIGELFYEALLEKVFLEADFRSLHRLQDEMAGEGAEGVEVTPEEAAKNLRETKRFMRRKEEIDKQIEKSQGSGKGSPAVEKGENNDFDVEEYEYEPEEYSYKHASVIASTSVEVKPEKPFYIPLTDVLYPGEVDSTYDLKKLLQGDYCLECDLDKEAPKKRKPDEGRLSFPSELFDALFLRTPSTESESQETLDSEDEKEIKKYLKNNADRVSFAGGTVKTMAKKGKINLFDTQRKSELIPDEHLRRIRLATEEYKTHREKKVSISMSTNIDTHKEIKRRQTGFVRKEDLARIRKFKKESDELDDDEDDDEDDEDGYEPYTRQVSVSEPAPTALEKSKIKRRQTGFVRPTDLEKVRVIEKTSSELLLDQLDEEESHKVHMVSEPSPKAQPQGARAMRRPTAFVRPGQYVMDDDDDDDDDDQYHDSDDGGERPSVLIRLYDEMYIDDMGPGPTLKDYKPLSEIQQSKAMFLTRSPARRIKNEVDVREKYRRRSLSLDLEDRPIDQVLLLQHGKKVYRKISSDYVRTIDHIEHREHISIRSVEFARKRPAISVSEYQKMNQQYQEHHTKSNPTLAMADESMKNATQGNDRMNLGGLRLPGDSPLYHSLVEIPHHHHHE